MTMTKRPKVKPVSGSVALREARAALRRRLKAVSAERDKLRDLKSDIEDLISSCDDAAEGLESAIDAISRFA